MKTNTLSLILATATAACTLSLSGQAAQAFTLGSNWNYTMDSGRDGTGAYNDVGAKSDYEMYGIAMKTVNSKVYVALNANMPLLGNSYSGAADGNIGWGDLFLNFTGKSFKDASAANQLFGIRFAGTNDSGAASTGVYKNVAGKSVAADNSGWSTFDGYVSGTTTHVDTTSGVPSGQTGQAGFGDLSVAQAKTYFTAQNGQISDTAYSIANVISSGTKIGDISLLGASDLAQVTAGFLGLGGLGKYTLGFSFDQSLLPSGDAIASLFFECNNDGLAANVKVESVPEPTTMLGVVLGGLGLVGGKLKKRRQASAVVAK